LLNPFFVAYYAGTMWLGNGGAFVFFGMLKKDLVKLYKVLNASNKVVSALIILLVKFYYLFG
jgi:uncharacterized membrane protein